MIPEPISRTAGLVCFETSDSHLGVACVDLSAIEKIEGMHDQKVVPYLTDSASLKAALKKYQKHQSESFGEQITSQITRMRDPESFKSIEENIPHRYQTEIAEDISTEKLMKNLLMHAETSGASHIYITPTDVETEISYRIDGGLYDAMRLPLSLLCWECNQVQVLFLVLLCILQGLRMFHYKYYFLEPLTEPRQ